jgi:hypothetical protein
MNAATSPEYHDRWIDCTDQGLCIRGYYFPWGTKRIPYGKIRAVQRVQMTVTRGKGRIWGTANPRYWASLDPKRASKDVALVLDVGRMVHPFITPDDPDAVEAAIRRHASVPPPPPASTGPVV